MSQIRYAMIVLAVLLACSEWRTHEPSPDGFAEAFSGCRQRAWTQCGGLFDCEESLRVRCMAELGWKRVRGEWLLGKDARRQQEIDRAMETRGERAPASVGTGAPRR